MSSEWRARSTSLAWSNPIAWWWALLTFVSAANIAIWLLLYSRFHEASIAGFAGPPAIELVLVQIGLRTPAPGTELMLVLSAAYVFGCAFRSLLPRADVQRICLFDTWLSSIAVGRSVATVAEICFVIQWAIVLRLLGDMVRSDTVRTISKVIVPLIVVAECCSWYAVVTTSFLGNTVENSIWA